MIVLGKPTPIHLNGVAIDVNAPKRLTGEDEHIQMQLCSDMMKVGAKNAIGVSLSYLLAISMSGPEAVEMLRRTLNEKIVREGFRGESMITLLNRIARS